MSSAVQKGTTIFAYFYLVVSVLLISVVVFCLYVIGILVSYPGEVDPAVIFLSVGVIAPLIMIPFASVFVHGVRRKNPDCLIAFIVFGVFKILFTVAIILFLLLDREQCENIFQNECWQPLIIIPTLVLCVVFGGSLVMIGFTASKYRKERQLQPNSVYDPLTTHPTYASTTTRTKIITPKSQAR